MHCSYLTGSSEGVRIIQEMVIAYPKVGASSIIALRDCKEVGTCAAPLSCSAAHEVCFVVASRDGRSTSHSLSCTQLFYGAVVVAQALGGMESATYSQA